MSDRNALANGLLNYMAMPEGSGPNYNALSMPSQTLSSYSPTWRDKIANALMGDQRASPERSRLVEALMGSRGVGSTGMGLLDLTPAGVPMQAQEAWRGGDDRALAMALMPGAKPVSKVIPKTAPEARKAAAELWRAMRNSPHEYHGLRATSDSLEVGKPVPHSVEWDRDKPTDVLLPGASTVGVDPYKSQSGPGSIPWALERMGFNVGGKSHEWDSYAAKGDQVSVVGANKRMHGQDTGEWILDGDVLAVLRGGIKP